MNQMEMECHRRITELHRFIEGWLNGSMDKTRHQFQYFDDALDDDFVLISPDGDLQSKQNIVSDFWMAHGAKSADFKIEIKYSHSRITTDNICIIHYEEHQIGNTSSARIGTAVFRKTADTLHWYHLHETWL
jgi:hypothetical protein